jgi:hypothetical protein
VQAIRDEMTLEFERASKVTDNFNIEELNRVLQTHKDEMNVEFNQKAQLEQGSHLKDLESTKVKLGEETKRIKREHAKETSHLQTELDENKQFVEQQILQINGLRQDNENFKEVLE